MRQRLKRFETLLVRAESALLVALISGMATLAFVQVALRQFFDSGAVWGDTLLRHLVLWVGFLGAALAAADDKHFSWETAAHRGGAKMKFASQIAAVVITAFLACAAVSFFKDEYRAGHILLTIGTVGVPGWLFTLSIPVGFCLVLLHTLLRAIAALTEV